MRNKNVVHQPKAVVQPIKPLPAVIKQDVLEGTKKTIEKMPSKNGTKITDLATYTKKSDLQVESGHENISLNLVTPLPDEV